MGVILATDGTEILLDPEDVALLGRHRWHEHNGHFMAMVLADGKDKLWLHHLVMGRKPESKTTIFATTINGNPADARKHNLAWVPKGIISHRMERPKRTPDASQFRGVIAASDGSWRASLTVEGRTFARNGLASEEQAARAYDEIAQRELGLWAVLNFPPEGRPLPPGVGRQAERRRLQTMDGARIQVDQEDLPLLTRHDWRLVEGVPMATVYGSMVPIYALILDATNHQEHRLEHLNGNGLDYRKANLAWGRTPNLRVQRRRGAPSKTGFRGVRPNSGGRFQASIKVVGRPQNLGAYDTAEEAARAYDRAARRIYGVEAFQNFPE